jgi:hypothetical protein
MLKESREGIKGRNRTTEGSAPMKLCKAPRRERRMEGRQGKRKRTKELLEIVTTTLPTMPRLHTHTDSKTRTHLKKRPLSFISLTRVSCGEPVVEERERDA